MYDGPVGSTLLTLWIAVFVVAAATANSAHLEKICKYAFEYFVVFSGLANKDSVIN